MICETCKYRSLFSVQEVIGYYCKKHKGSDPPYAYMYNTDTRETWENKDKVGCKKYKFG